MGKRPGIMVYFELLDALEDYNAEEAGQLFLAMLRYGQYGELPEFADRGMRTLWMSTKRKIDMDNRSYEQACCNRRYSTYVREAKKRGETILDRDEWEIRQQEETSNDINSIQLQQEPQPEPEQEPQQQPQQQPQQEQEYTPGSHQPSAGSCQPSAGSHQPSTGSCGGLSGTAADFERRKVEALDKLYRHRAGVNPGAP